MLIYILLVITILILPLFKIEKKKYCIIIGILMTCIVGFRSIEMGMGDTKLIYVSIFDQLAGLSLKESYLFIKNSDIEVVFYFLTRIYLLITNNVRIYILILSIPLNYSVAKIIYKYSKIPSLSFIMFLSLNYFGFSFTLLRHCIALAILIHSYEYICKREFKKFAFIVFIAGLFHRTAWVFIIAYPISNKLKIGLKNISIPLIAAIISYAFGEKILVALSYFIKSGHFIQYLTVRENTITFFLMNFLMLIFTLCITKKSDYNGEIKQQINLLTIGTSIASCMVFLSEAFRISTFFTIYSILLLPNVISSIKSKKARLVIEIMLYIIFITYFFMFSINNNEIYPYILGGWKR